MTSGSVSSPKLEQLHRSHMRDAALDEVFIVLSVGASLISTLGLLANSPAYESVELSMANLDAYGDATQLPAVVVEDDDDSRPAHDRCRVDPGIRNASRTAR